MWIRVIEYIGQVPDAESHDDDISKMVDDVGDLHEAVPWHGKRFRIEDPVVSRKAGACAAVPIVALAWAGDLMECSTGVA